MLGVQALTAASMVWEDSADQLQQGSSEFAVTHDSGKKFSLLPFQ